MPRELHLSARSPQFNHWFWWLRLAVRTLLKFKVLAFFRPLAARVAGVTRPAGQIYFEPAPALPVPITGNQVTILSVNICHDWPRHRRLHQRLEAVAKLGEAEGADIILLQEVARTAEFRSDEWLAQRLGMAHVYARANGHETGAGFEEGLAIYSRYPLEQPFLTELAPTINPFTRRLGLGVEIKLPVSRLMVFSVHLGLTPRQNALQLTHLQKWIGQIAGNQPALIGGDFNAHETTARIKHLRQTWQDTFRHLHPHKDGTTHHLQWPWGITRRRYDYHFLHGEPDYWHIFDAQHLELPNSPHADHRAVLTRLHYKKNPGA